MTATTFVYPWIYEHNGALWDLIHSLRSIDEHWLTPVGYQVLIVGDMPPTLANGLLFQPLPQVPPNTRWRRCVDVCQKLAWALNCPTVGERFVYMYDDVLFLQPTDESYLSQRVALKELLPGSEHAPRDLHVYKAKTEKALRAAGLTGPLWDFETHMPRLFDRRKMQEVFEKFQPGVNALLFSTLYFNWHFRREGPGGPTTEVLPPTLLHPMDRHLVRFSSGASHGLAAAPIALELPHQVAYYRNHMIGKHLLNYGSKASIRTKALIEAIKERFPAPGPYETGATHKHLTSTLLTNGQFSIVH